MQKILIENYARQNNLQITETQYAQLQTHQTRVLETNRHMNLTAITNETDFAIKHIIDSLTLLPYIPENSTLIDIGTGAGFPGLVLAITRPDLQITLLDSLLKRIKFLRETAVKLPDISVQTHHARAEDHAKTHPAHYDICTARAVAPMEKLARYALPLIKPGGTFLAMKAENINEELQTAAPTIKKLGGTVESVNTVQLTDDLRRAIIVIRK